MSARGTEADRGTDMGRTDRAASLGASEETAALRAAYDRAAATYGNVRNPRYDAFVEPLLHWFAEQSLAVGDRVLDLGSGPGHESALLARAGLRPLAIDFSPAMVERCRARGLEAEVMDMRELDLPSGAFAGALLSFSLLHLPKREAAEVVRCVVRALLPGGTLLVLLFEGDGEGPREADRHRFGVARWFSYYRPAELRGLLQPHADVIGEWRHDISPRPTLACAGRRPMEVIS